MSDKTSDKTSDKYRITLTHKQLDLICHAVDMMLGMAALSGKNKSDDELEYETIYSAILSFENAEYAYVRGYCFPMQSGNEPIPEIERVE